jgi:hypothetical protein
VVKSEEVERDGLGLLLFEKFFSHRVAFFVGFAAFRERFTNFLLVSLIILESLLAILAKSRKKKKRRGQSLSLSAD